MGVEGRVRGAAEGLLGGRWAEDGFIRLCAGAKTIAADVQSEQSVQALRMGKIRSVGFERACLWDAGTDSMISYPEF